jgi:7-carboxy-7-deazaguanine synthase
LSVEAVAARIVRSPHSLLVITGGEPLLQQEAIEVLLDALPRALRIEVETNGTIVPSPKLSARVDQWNVSPKLSNSGEPEQQRHKLEALRALGRTDRAWLKFVVDTLHDVEEADLCVRSWGWRRDRVVLMPCATTPEDLRRRGQWVVEACLRHGWRYSTRLQVELWDGQRGT